LANLKQLSIKGPKLKIKENVVNIVNRQEKLVA
jgi:hypothetical protein